MSWSPFGSSYYSPGISFGPIEIVLMLLLPIGLSIAGYFLFIRPGSAYEHTWLGRYLNFDHLYIQTIIKVFHLVIAVCICVISVVLLFTPAAILGILNFVVAIFINRLAYEKAIISIRQAVDVHDLRNKFCGAPRETPKQKSSYSAPVPPQTSKSSSFGGSSYGQPYGQSAQGADFGAHYAAPATPTAPVPPTAPATGAPVVNNVPQPTAGTVKSAETTRPAGGAQPFGVTPIVPPQAAPQEWICPKCGRHNTGAFCPKCGTKRP